VLSRGHFRGQAWEVTQSLEGSWGRMKKEKGVPEGPELSKGLFTFVLGREEISR